MKELATLQPSNVAVIGCGYWGKNLVRNFAQLGALKWLCDTSEAALAAQAKLFPGLQTTMSFETVLADPDVRAVVVATPAVMHYEQCKQALLAGKDVFVEKPLALRYEDGCELDALAKSRGAVLMVGHILEYHPAVVLLKRLVDDGELGKLLYLYSNRLNLGKIRQEENILWSFAPHDISVINTLVGRPAESVSSHGSSYLQSGIADVTMTNLIFDEGVRAHIFVSWLHPFKEQKLVVVGDRKMVVFDDTIREGKLKLYDKGVEWKGGIPVPRQTSETTLFLDEVEPLREECSHFLACVASRETPRTDGRNALGVLKTLAACQTSLEAHGALVPLASLDKKVGV